MTDQNIEDISRLLDSMVFCEAGWQYLVWRRAEREGGVPTSYVRRLTTVVEQLPDSEYFLRRPRTAIRRALADAGFKRDRKHGRVLIPESPHVASSHVSRLRTLIHERLAPLSALTGSETDPDVWADGILERPLTRGASSYDAEDEVAPIAAHFPPGSWQYVAATRIADLVTRPTLLSALGADFVRALRRSRRELEGRDSAGSNVELVEALILQHEHDLLRNSPPLRNAIGRACGVEAPRAFHAGKATALQFVEAVGLPVELAGLPSPPPLPAVTLVDAPAGLPPLHDYQEEVRARLADAAAKGGSVLCSLPTGAGKTRVALEALCQVLAGPGAPPGKPLGPPRPVVLWVAHTQELCAQAVQALRSVWQVRVPGKRLLLGSTTASSSFDKELDATARHPWDAAVVITTAIGGVRLLEGGLLSRLSVDGLAVLRIVVIDEAHRAAAPTYRALVEAARRSADGTTGILGLTATPFRSSPGGAEQATASLRDIFDELIVPEVLGEDPKRTLIERRCLAYPTHESLKGVSLSLGEAGTDDRSGGDDGPIDQALSTLAARSAPRRRHVLERIRSLVAAEPHARVLYFGPSVGDAQVIAFLLRRAGIAAGVVSAKTRTSVRREIIRGFRDGRLQVLCNHEVLTTGFDDPKITHVVVARPTVSLVLYEQMIGRGLRGPVFGGTPTCHIISVEDRYAEPEGRAAAWKQFLQTWSPHVGAR